MDIAQIRKLDVGMSGITCAGQVGYVGDAQNPTGVKDGKAYNFWSQFITIEDQTDTIGVSISAKDRQSLLTRGDKGRLVTVEKCTLKSYEDKDGKTQLKLQGFLQNSQQQAPQQAPQQQQNNKKEPDWDAIARGKVRNSVVCAFIQALQGRLPEIGLVEYWTDYIMTGRNPDAIPEPDASIQEQDDIPF